MNNKPDGPSAAFWDYENEYFLASSDLKKIFNRLYSSGKEIATDFVSTGIPSLMTESNTDRMCEIVLEGQYTLPH